MNIKTRLLAALRSLPQSLHPDYNAIAGELREVVRQFRQEPMDAVTLNHIQLSLVDKMNHMVRDQQIWGGRVTDCEFNRERQRLEISLEIVPNLSIERLRVDFTVA